MRGARACLASSWLAVAACGGSPSVDGDAAGARRVDRRGRAACDETGGACWDLVRLQPGAWREIPAP